MTREAKVFVALPCTPEVQAKLYGIGKQIKDNDPGCRVVPQQNLHLTLAFLGNIQRSQIDDVKKALPPKVRDGEVWIITNAGTFHRSTLSFASGASTDYLDSLSKQIRSELTKLGFKFDTKPFKPHITLARNTSTKPTVIFEPISMPILPPVLFESILDAEGRRRYKRL
ncbi:MAG: RNA 2',3'-cyclic phosphodiesterase [Burkholderiales bacterium]|nr:RNA 2',3'-cyclic phosphodiesterase [Burkholderiales bacterium]